MRKPPADIAWILSACSTDHRAELTTWMNENSQNLRGGVPKLPDILALCPCSK